MIAKVDFKDEETLQQLDRNIDSYEASNHYPPRLFCSQETMLELSKHKCRFPMMKNIDRYKDADYYICKIVVDDTLLFGEIDLK